jgi:hypothetical protein
MHHLHSLQTTARSTIFAILLVHFHFENKAFLSASFLPFTSVSGLIFTNTAENKPLELTLSSV